MSRWETFKAVACTNHFLQGALDLVIKVDNKEVVCSEECYIQTLKGVL